MNVWVRSRTALSMAALLALAACGGGGGGGSSSSGSAPTTVAVAGVASKGLLAYAKVTAYAIKSDGTADASKVLGSAITDANGAYQINGLPPSAPVILEVTPLPAEGTRPATKMKDEATGDEVEVTVASDFRLSAAVVLDATGATTAQVTPLTDMALKFAQAQAAGPSAGVPIADVIKVANDRIAEAMGVALNAPPTFDSAGAPTNEAAVKLAAVSELAQSECSDSTTLAKIQCAVELLRNEVKDLPKAGDPLLSGDFVTDFNAAQGAVETPVGVTVAVAPVVAGNTQVAVGGESKTAIQEAKDLIRSVRTTVEALTNQSDVTSLAVRVKAVQDASYGVAQPLDDGTVSALQALSKAVTEYQKGATGAFFVNEGTWYANNHGQLSSGCKYFTTDTFVTVSVTPTIYLGCRVLQHVGYDAQGRFAVYHRIGLTNTATNQFTVQSILARAPINDDGLSAPTYGAETLLSTLRTMSLTVDNFNAAAFDGDIDSVDGEFAPGYEVSWSNSGESVTALGTHQRLLISLGTTNDATYKRYHLQGDVDVYQGAAILSRFKIKPGSYVQEPLDGGTTAQSIRLDLEAQLKDKYKFGGTVTASHSAAALTRDGPETATLIGYLTDMEGAHLFDGTLLLAMPTDSGLNWEATLNGTLVTTGTKTLAVNLTAKQSDTVKGDFTVNGRYTEGSTTFLLTLLSSEATPANDQLTLTTTAGGVGFVAKRSDTVVPIKKGATVLGQFNVGSSRLVYADGTYEQF